MTIAYYHGAPGSYKTASMVKDWLLPCSEPPPRSFLDRLFGRPEKTFKKRHVYTNIRGVKPTEYIHVLDSRAIVDALFVGERGSLFLIDELGQVFDYVDAKKFVHPSSALQSEENGTIEIVDTLPILFDKHRHFGYDIIGTAPSHKRVPVFFQSIAEFGYRHRALASAGLKGFYSQAEHLGHENGSSSQVIRSQIKKMPKRVFSYYKSTATGDHKESPITSSGLFNPKIIFGGLFALGLFFYCGSLVLDMKDRRFSGSTEKEKNEVDDGSRNVAAGSSRVGSSDPIVPKGFVPNPKAVVKVVENFDQASDYIDSFLSDDKSYIRLSYVNDSYAFFTFGTCFKSLELKFRSSSKGRLVFDSVHTSFSYDFEFKRLKYKNERLVSAPFDCKPEHFEEDQEGSLLASSE